MLEKRYRPAGDMVLVKKVMKDETDGGIALVGTARASGHLEVLAVGPGRVTDQGCLIEPRVKTGDVVIAKSATFFHQPPDAHGSDVALIEEGQIACYVNTGEVN